MNRKILTCTLIFALLFSGCSKTSFEKADFLAVEAQVQEIADLIQKGRFSKLPLARSCAKSKKEIKQEMNEYGISFHQDMDVEDYVDDDGIYGRVCIKDAKQPVAVEFELDQKGNIIKFNSYPFQQKFKATEDEDLVEEIYYVGHVPKLEVVITRLKQEEHDPVIVFVQDVFQTSVLDPNGFYEHMAKEFARHHYAVCRMNFRPIYDPYVLTKDEMVDLRRIYQEDLASLLHQLDQMPVDASRITLLGFQYGANLLFDTNYHHFEANHGMILVDPVDEIDGVAAFLKSQKVDDETIEKTLKQVSKTKKSSTMIEGYPASFYNQLAKTSMSNYGSVMVQPIYMLSGLKPVSDLLPRYQGVNVSRDDFTSLYDLENKIVTWLKMQYGG